MCLLIAGHANHARPWHTSWFLGGQLGRRGPRPRPFLDGTTSLSIRYLTCCPSHSVHDQARIKSLFPHCIIHSTVVLTTMFRLETRSHLCVTNTIYSTGEAGTGTSTWRDL